MTRMLEQGRYRGHCKSNQASTEVRQDIEEHKDARSGFQGLGSGVGTPFFHVAVPGRSMEKFRRRLGFAVESFSFAKAAVDEGVLVRCMSRSILSIIPSVMRPRA
jgi:hypothetical protein